MPTGINSNTSSVLTIFRNNRSVGAEIKSRTVPTGHGGPKSFGQKETAVLVFGLWIHGGSITQHLRPFRILPVGTPALELTSSQVRALAASLDSRSSKYLARAPNPECCREFTLQWAKVQAISL